ncbi:hypothetical protein PCASD_18518 [Puccinia coronata f. sp. avenae]|uniref:Integrase catalytic domain-containing protein n=1 Tax=Puccinia coronata f. sp. avenae TaxID=200324 RepID=A0A2N5SYJ1_9BASI|nr:hypothetical protein PCASD_18518 [Puccinia coronata f. sp. avenae]
MSAPTRKKSFDNLPSSSNHVIRLGSSSPSIPNQTGKSTKERIDEQIGALKDALTIPFLTSPPASAHDNQPPPPHSSQLPLTQFHYTPTPYAASPADTTHYDINHNPQPISAPYYTATTMASAIPPYLQPSHFNPPMPDFHHQAHPHNPYSSPPHHPSSHHHTSTQFSHETATPRQTQTQPNPYAAVVKVIRPRDALLADGSNYWKWARWLRELASQFFYDPDFFTKPTSNIHNEKIGRAIILHSVDASLKDEASNCNTCYDAMKNLRARFCSVCCLAQISTFLRLLRVEPDSFETTAAYAVEMRNILSDLKALDIQITEDQLLGFLLQINLKDGPIKQALTDRVESVMYADPLHKTPTFKQLLTMLNGCKRQVQFSSPSNTNPFHVPSPALLHASAFAESNELFSPQTTKIDEGDNSHEITANAAKSNNCHICRQQGHWAAKCPVCKKPPPSKPQWQQSNPNYSSQLGFNPYCPIFVAPNFPTYGHHFPVPPYPNSSSPYPSQSKTSHPNTPNNPPTRPHDSYKPNYSKPRQDVSAKHVDIGDIEDEIAKLQLAREMMADAISARPKTISDTGATNHLTGDKFALSDFKTLSSPIPLRVATEGCSNCITGVGTLTFPGKNGTTVSVKGVMYCEQASSTLISPAALRRANVLISYDTSRDCFLYKNAAGRILLESHLDEKRRTWTLPDPIIPPSCLSSSSFTTPSTPVSPVSVIPSLMPNCDAMPSAPLKSKEATEPIFTSPIEKFTFQWNVSDLTKDELQLLFWHRLFGHAGLRRICKLAKLKLGVGIPENLPKGEIKCPVCMIAKGTRSNKLLPSYRLVEKLGIIACNLIGPFEIPTFDDGKYILTIRDLSTSYSEIKILKNKGETAKILMEQITKFETVTGKKVKCIRSDNGGEFESNVLAEFIKSKGIQAKRSLPYHHYQNGAIERFNRTIQDMGCAALTDSCLPKSFWGFAFL